MYKVRIHFSNAFTLKSQVEEIGVGPNESERKKSPLESFSPSSAIEVGVVCVVRAFFPLVLKLVQCSL